MSGIFFWTPSGLSILLDSLASLFSLGSRDWFVFLSDWELRVGVAVEYVR